MSSSITTQAKSASTATFITSLVTNVAVFAIEVGAFTVIRRRFKVIYSPRTFIPIPSKRSKPLTKSLLKWPIDVFRANYDDIRRQNGLDAFVFVRFLRMMVKILLPIWLISWAILLPVDAAGKTQDLQGLDRFTFGNISQQNQARYVTHLVLAWLFTFWILYVLKSEMRHFITVRQRHLTDSVHAASAQASTVLVTGVPRKYLQVGSLRSIFAPLPGGIRAIWINRDLKDLPDLFDARLDALNRLESAETALLNTATKLQNKRQQKIAKGKISATDSLPEDIDPEKKLSLADKFVPRNARPTHRTKPHGLGWLPFGLPYVGQKVDSIEWAREEVARLNQEIEMRQNAVFSEMHRDYVSPEEEQYPPMNSVFVRFNEPIAAHMAATSLIHHEPYRMSTKYTEVTPEDIIWGNINLNPYEAKIRTALSYGATAGLIILWAFPVAFIGFISNIHSLCAKFSWLAWICKLPEVVVGIISGILPPVLLALLMMILPIILRLLGHFEGIPRRTNIELSLMTRYFIFQVIHSFLIVTLSSGLIKSLPALASNPTSVPSLLAQNLPGASTFFLTYILLQGLSGAAGGLLQIVPLIIYYVKLFLMGSTPRSVYRIKNTMREVSWGTQFPNITLLAVITIAYSVISPIINGLACVAFFLLYHVWKYLFLYQLDQPPSSDTGGLFFPKAITHIFVGLYVEQICLAALFFLARDIRNNASAIPQGALMVVLIVITAGFHLILIDSYSPLFRPLPLSLVEKTSSGKTSIETSVRDSADVQSLLRRSNSQRKDETEQDAVASATARFSPLSPSSSSSPSSLMRRKTSASASGVATEGDVADAARKKGKDISQGGEGEKGEAHKMDELEMKSNVSDVGVDDDEEAEKTSAGVEAGEEEERAREEALQKKEERERGQSREGSVMSERKRKGTVEKEDVGRLLDFVHPALGPVRTVWIPQDRLGLWEEELRAIRECKVDVSVEHAIMDEKGHVDATDYPPGEKPKDLE